MTRDEIAALRERARIAAALDLERRKTLPVLTDEQRQFAVDKFGGVPTTVHFSHWSSQPAIGYACGSSTTPAWGQPERNNALGYLGDDGGIYIFGGDAADRVTCPGCRAWIAARVAEGCPPI